MRRYFILAIMLFATTFSFAQTVRTENFDNPNAITLTGIPTNGWRIDTDYYVSSPNAYKGVVPNKMGDSIVLETPVYDFRGLNFIQMRFKQICKISPRDNFRIEYRATGQTWQTLPSWTYEGDAFNYGISGFSAASYAQWQQADSLAVPNNSWWKEELFDVSDLVSDDASVQFRFILKRGTTPGTNIAYGCLLDDFEIITNSFTIKPPVVNMILAPQDTIYSVGPYAITANIATSTIAALQNPVLSYTATNGTNIVTDNLSMTNTSSDIWTATIPTFVVGTRVDYTITAQDAYGNQTVVSLWYYINKYKGDVGVTSDYIYYSPKDTIGTAGNAWTLFHANRTASGSRHLYMNSELEGINPITPQVITEIAWFSDDVVALSKTNVRVYMEATTLTSYFPAVWINPDTTSATLVYKGGISGANGWASLDLQTAFILPAGQNLIVYFIDSSGTSGTAKRFVSTANTNGAYENTTGAIVTPSAMTPILRLGRGEIKIDEDNSVALSSIDNPAKGTIVSGSSDPIVVTFQNRGNFDLDSVKIYWQVNNGNVDSTVWRGNLLWGHKQQETIGYYNARIDNFDTITVWVALPNGETDVVTFDDTLTTIQYACGQPISGRQVVGVNGPFYSINHLFEVFRNCGDGDLIIVLDTGVHQGTIDLKDISNTMGNYSLTITSITDDANDVIIRPTAGAGIVLNNSNNITIKAVTVDASATGGTYAIQFTGACNDVLIRDCRLLANPTATTTAYAPVYKAGSTRSIDNVSFINNLIDGGYYGICLYGTSTTNYNTDILIDSNTISNSYHSGFFTYYSWFTISHNAFSARSANSISNWTGIYLFYANGDITDNYIYCHDNANTTSNPYGIYLRNYHTNVNPTSRRGLVANNEIRLHASGASRGIDVPNFTAKANILNNSIYVGGTGNSNGIYVQNVSPAHDLVVKNNDIFMAASGSYPIYLGTTAYLNQWVLDYNNMYAPTYVGYAGADHLSISSWQSIVPSDKHSIRVAQQFTNGSTMKVSNYLDYLCELDTLVRTDFDGKARMAITTMGCYDNIPNYTVNGSLMGLIGLRNGSILGQSDSLKLILYNAGTSPITDFNIEWSLNGTSQKVGGINFSTSLNQGQYDTVNLGTITYTAGAIDIEIWINSVNNNPAADQNKSDDTLRLHEYICNSALSGTIFVSDTSTFTTIEDALTKISLCGLAGDLTLALAADIYQNSLNLTDISERFGTYSLTVTSISENAEDVVIRPLSGAGVVLNNSNNITLEHITIDATTSGTHAIYFEGTCSDVTIRNCELYANPSASSQIVACGIYKSLPDPAHNISIVNNLIDGGFANIYFYGGSADATRGTNIRIDSNTLQNHYQVGIQLHYGNIKSISRNTVLRNQESVSTTWNGIRLEYVNGSVIGNKLHHLGRTTSTTWGIYLNYYNFTDGEVIANNEIISKTTGNSVGGIYLSSTQAVIIHNSILVKGNPYSVGIYTNWSMLSGRLVIKNNNIVMDTTNTYPIYLSSTSYLSTWDIDCNNMSGPTYVGYYMGGGRATIEAWQSVVPSDLHSVSVRPNFRDTAISLEIGIDENLLCPIHPSVTTDIDGNDRTNQSNVTTMGAYGGYLSAVDLGLIGTTKSGIVNNSQNVPVFVEAWNLGSTFINGATFGWSLDNIDQGTYSWTASNPLASFSKAKIMVGSFPASVGNTYEIKVWINTVNGSVQTTTHNDTIIFTFTPEWIDLAWFEEPLVGDTIRTLSFDVYTQIMEETGATVNTPEMQIQTIVNNEIVFYDTIPLVYVNGLWVANIPQQYYNSKVIYSLTISDTIGNTLTIMDSTYIYNKGTELYDKNNLTLASIEKFTFDGALCSEDYGTVEITMTNTGNEDYDFSVTPITLAVEVTTPRPFYHNMLVNTGTLLAGNSMNVILTTTLPTANAGLYDVKAWLSSPLDNMIYDDTLMYYYQSEKFGLPVDATLDSYIPDVFYLKNNTSNQWTIVSQGTGADVGIMPQEGTGMLAFSGSRGSMSSLYTNQLDLSRAIRPTLSFWYYHDNTPCNDYTEVRLTVDGGASDTTLLSLVRYNPTYSGWKQYEINLPAFAVNQCVVLYFEAMVMSSGNVAQYIDHVLITATQEIVVSDIFTSELTACDMQNKEWKVVLSNLTAPDLHYNVTHLEVTLELIGTPHIFTKTISTGIFEGFSSDTITMTSGFDFAPGTYIAKAYISSIFGDIFMDTIAMNPSISVRIQKLSDCANNLVSGGIEIGQAVVVTNTGNMDLSNMDINLVLDIHSDSYNFRARGSFSDILHPGDTFTYTFTDKFIAPMDVEYYINVIAYLSCDSVMVNADTSETECVDMDDLYIVDMINPTGSIDNVGEVINLKVSVANRSYQKDYEDVEITALIVDLNGVEIDRLDGVISQINLLDTVNHEFSRGYTVPELTNYTIIVYIKNMDNYLSDDTMYFSRITNHVEIKNIDKLTISMGQNIPNPANNSTIIKYRVPNNGEVNFKIYSVSGQILYNNVENVQSGEHQIEINTSSFAAGIYFYTMEFEGQRLTKRMSIRR